MAQTGKPGIIASIPYIELGRVSGPGGIIGAIVWGYQYYPLKDEMNFEEVIPMLVIDKINTVSNLPNRTNPNAVENQTHVIDMYMGFQIENFEESELNIIGKEVSYIPSHYITKIQALPGIECCDTILASEGGDEGGGEGGEGGEGGAGGGGEGGPLIDLAPDRDLGEYTYTP